MNHAVAQTAEPPHKARMADLYDRMAEQSLAPLWDIYQNLVTREPTASEPSLHWRWKELLPTIERSAEAVTGELADHRVLLLRNPALAPKMSTTFNLIAGVQCVMPGERTIEHRHTASACRLILEGKGGKTFVDGKACAMNTGDFIITPNWTWHGHLNDSDSRAIWLDMLDVPLNKTLDTTFGGQGPAQEYPEYVSTIDDRALVGAGLMPVTDRPSMPYSPRFRWAWEDTVAALAHTPAAADGSRTVRFTNPLDGGAIMPTMDALMMEVPAGAETRAFRSSANGLCVVLEGEGESRIGDATHRWGPRDIMTLPHWQWVSHRCDKGPARMLVVSDRETMRRLSLLREERAA